MKMRPHQTDRDELFPLSENNPFLAALILPFSLIDFGTQFRYRNSRLAEVGFGPSECESHSALIFYHSGGGSEYGSSPVGKDPYSDPPPCAK